jgi:hypothetical protein
MGCGTAVRLRASLMRALGELVFPDDLNGWTGIVGDYEFPEG